jgi:hypothetical protein
MFENFEKTIIDLQFLGPAAIWAVWFSDMVTQQFELKLVEGRQSLLVYDDWEHSFKEETGEIIILMGFSCGWQAAVSKAVTPTAHPTSLVSKPKKKPCT